MSAVSNKLEWCIKKAAREIKESTTDRKRQKHRGLLKIDIDMDLVRDHIRKAQHDLDAIDKFRNIGYSDWSINAAFYSIYHCFLAIAAKFGYESRNQECTIILIEYLKENNKINIENKFIEMLKYRDVKDLREESIIDMREDYTYGIEISVEDNEKIDELIEICKELIDLTKNIVFK